MKRGTLRRLRGMSGIGATLGYRRTCSRIALGLLTALVMWTPCFAASKANQPPKPTVEDCLVCHGDKGLSTERNGKPVSLFVDAGKFKSSMHGTMFTCVDCHTDLKSSPHEAKPAKVECKTCHADQQAAYERSFHAKAIAAGDTKAATCSDCHGSPHELLAAGDPNSRVSHANIPKTCGTCHGEKFVMGASGHSTQPFLSYEQSVHGRAVAN